jgi:hypothetical protein
MEELYKTIFSYNILTLTTSSRIKKNLFLEVRTPLVDVKVKIWKFKTLGAWEKQSDLTKLQNS